MWKYEKKLQYPINIKKKDLKMAKYIVTQLGGKNGELGAALRYLNQRYTMPDEKGYALLTSIGTEEMGHAEMISTMITQLLHGTTIKDLEENGLLANYVEHGFNTFPTDANGVLYSADYVVTGDVMADLYEDMAAEQKARATYENLINITNDPDVLAPLSFLRQREIIHFERFKELYDEYKDKYFKK